MLHMTLKLQSAYRVRSAISPEGVYCFQRIMLSKKNEASLSVQSRARVGTFEISDLTLRASFHSDLLNYIFKYPVIQVIWRIKHFSEKIQYLAYAIHVFIFFYYIILIFILAFNATVNYFIREINSTNKHKHTVALLFVRVTVDLLNLWSMLCLSQAFGCCIFCLPPDYIFDIRKALSLFPKQSEENLRASWGFIYPSLLDKTRAQDYPGRETGTHT